jgi:outer membrane protein assembly factor BamB
MIRQFGAGAIAVMLLLYPIAASAQSDTAWVRHYNGLGNGSDRVEAMAVDAAGNVVVTGISSGGASYDFATVKYNEAGKTLWERRYNAPGDLDESPTALAVDDHGYVYVAGLSIRAGTGADFIVLKYDPDGTLLWSRSYDGPAHSEDWPQAIALSRAGEVYVTGWSGGVGTGRDITTLKYDTDGNLIWERRYNGPINQTDVAGSIALDRDGNVFVGGSVAVDSSDDGEVKVYLTECAILKYSPAGDLLWERQYQRPERWSDAVIALDVDGLGNVIAAAGIFGGHPAATSGCSNMMAMVRFFGPSSTMVRSISMTPLSIWPWPPMGASTSREPVPAGAMSGETLLS